MGINISSLRYRREQLGGYLFAAPALALLMLLILYPVLYGLFISLFNTNLVNRWEFVGPLYYMRSFTNPRFLNSLLTTFVFTVVVVAGHTILGVLFAVLLNRKRFPARTFFRSILILPWFFPEVVGALIWRWMLHPLYGLVNYGLRIIGLIDHPLEWLSSTELALPAVMTAVIWKGYPLVLILVLAGLQSIPEELYEAATIDGAGRRQNFVRITLPCLSPVLAVTLTLDTMWWFKHFTIVWTMTEGGPIDATNIVAIDIYKTAFAYFRYGEGAAIAVIVFIFVVLFNFGYREFFRRRWVQ